MFRLYLRLSLLLCSVFGVLTITLIAMHYERNPVAILTVIQDHCVRVCLFDIEPGKTSVQQARTLLQNHDWIADVREFAPGTGYAHISWGWSGKQPTIIDASQRGKLTFVWDDDDPLDAQIGDAIVEAINFYSNAGIFLFQDWYGETTIGSVNVQVEGVIRYAVYYNRSGSHIGFHIDMLCPTSFVKYWWATTRITLSVGQIRSSYITPLDMINMC